MACVVGNPVAIYSAAWAFPFNSKMSFRTGDAQQPGKPHKEFSVCCLSIFQSIGAGISKNDFIRIIIFFSLHAKQASMMQSALGESDFFNKFSYFQQTKFP